MSYPSCFYSAKYHLPTGFLVGLMLLSVLLSGCASEPTLSESQATTPQTSRHNSSGHKAAYNRPYKVKGKKVLSAFGFQLIALSKCTYPPSTWISCPVVCDDLSEIRKATVSAISLAVVILFPNGIFLMISCKVSFGFGSVLIQLSYNGV